MRAQRKDRNQGEVVAALRGCGCVVVVMDREAGFDLLVGLPGGRGWVCVEVKDGELPPSARKLTAAEVEFRILCKSKGLPYRVVETIEDALDIVEPSWPMTGVM